LNLKPHLAYVEHKLNNLILFGGNECYNSLGFHSTILTRSPKFVDYLKNEIKKITHTQLVDHHFRSSNRL